MFYATSKKTRFASLCGSLKLRLCFCNLAAAISPRTIQIGPGIENAPKDVLKAYVGSTEMFFPSIVVSQS
jgi:hypothetical protein